METTVLPELMPTFNEFFNMLSSFRFVIIELKVGNFALQMRQLARTATTRNVLRKNIFASITIIFSLLPFIAVDSCFSSLQFFSFCFKWNLHCFGLFTRTWFLDEQSPRKQLLWRSFSYHHAFISEFMLVVIILNVA